MSPCLYIFFLGEWLPFKVCLRIIERTCMFFESLDKDWFHNLQSPVENGNVEWGHFKNYARISWWWQHSNKSSLRAFWAWSARQLHRSQTHETSLGWMFAFLDMMWCFSLSARKLAPMHFYFRLTNCKTYTFFSSPARNDACIIRLE